MVDDRLSQRLQEAKDQLHSMSAKSTEHDNAASKMSEEVISDSVIDKAKQSTVQVITSGKDGPRGVGSGFIVGAGNEIVTNMHVIGGARSIDVTTASGEHFAARVKRVDEINDLALLQVDGMNADSSRAVKFGSTADLKPYSKLFTSGHPNGVEETVVTEGSFKSLSTYSRLVGLSEAGEWLKAVPIIYGDKADQYAGDALKYIAAPRVEAIMKIEHGNSGGLVQNAQGETIGVAANITKSKPGEGFLIPSEKVQGLLGTTDNRFEFAYDKESKFDQHPWLIGAKDAAMVGLGLKFRNLAAPVFGAAYGLDLINDVKMASSSNLFGKRSDYIKDAALDATGLAGGILSMNSKTRMIGFGMVGARTLYEIGSDFFKGDPVLNHVKRTDLVEPKRTGEPLYWSLIDRVNANNEQVAPRSSSIHGIQNLRH